MVQAVCIAGCWVFDTVRGGGRSNDTQCCIQTHRSLGVLALTECETITEGSGGRDSGMLERYWNSVGV